jgi:hypothetical protein
MSRHSQPSVYLQRTPSTIKSLTPGGVIDRLGAHFNLVDVIHLPSYAWRMPELYTHLKSIKKDRYEHNDRIVFVMDDINFYIANQISPVMHNLQQFLYKLDIPNYFCVIVTEQTYVANEANQVRSLYGKEKCNISVLDVVVDSWLKIKDIPPLDCNFDLIERSYIMLSRVERKHRVLLFAMLKQAKILDQGLISFKLGEQPHELPYQQSDFELKVDQIDSDMQFISVWPWTCAGENWIIGDDFQEQLYDQFLKKSPRDFEFKNFSETAVTDYYAHNNVVQRAFLYLGTESVFQYPGVSFTEKSFKGISNKRPFVIVGPPGNLKKLRDLGFKTFDHWWDESYDQIQDHSQRMAAVFEIIKFISKKSRTELIELGNAMQNVLQYNYDLLINQFTQLQLQRLDQQCVENLKPRYDTN